MPEVTMYVFLLIWVVVWISVSVYSMVFFFKNTQQSMKPKHWTLKVGWWYGFGFYVLLIGSVLVGFATVIGMLIFRGLQ